MVKNSKNQITSKIWTNYLRQYYLKLCISRFKWSGFDESIIPKYPEYFLAKEGMCAIVSMPDILEKPFPLPVSTQNIFSNIYGYPSEWNCIALGDKAGFINSKRFNWENSCIIWDNNIHKSPLKQIDYLIQQISRVDSASRLNLLHQSTPWLIKSNEKKILSDLNTFKSIYEFEPVIIQSSLNPTEITDVLNTKVEFIGESLTNYLWDIDTRIRLMLGIQVNRRDKDSRIVEKEAMGDDEVIQLVRKSALSTREYACEHFNKIYGTDIQVEWNVKVDEISNVANIPNNLDGSFEERSRI